MVAHRLAMVALLAVPSHALLPPLAARAPVHLRPSKAPRLAPVKLTSGEEAADTPAAPTVGLIARRLPILTWAPKLTSARIIGDIIAGLTVATVLIPQGMSYATVAGLNPTARIVTTEHCDVDAGLLLDTLSGWEPGGDEGGHHHHEKGPHHARKAHTGHRHGDNHHWEEAGHAHQV